jgi:hypothetical protein
MTKPESLPVEEARKKFADILDGTQFRSTHTEITRRGKAAGVVVPPEWYGEAVEALTEKRRKAAGSPPSAAATPRVQVSEPLPPEPELTEPTATVPLPEMSPREIHKVIKRAMTRAKPDQRERLNLTAKNAEQLGRDRDGTLLRTALEMGLLKHDEVYAEPERPAASEEASA